jgi:hypothetical protein
MSTKYKYQVVRKCTKWPEKNSEIFYLKAYVICKNTQISVLLSKYVYLLATLLMYEVAFKKFSESKFSLKSLNNSPNFVNLLFTEGNIRLWELELPQKNLNNSSAIM